MRRQALCRARSPRGANNLIDIFNRIRAYLTFLGEKLRFHITQRGSHTAALNLRGNSRAMEMFLFLVYTTIIYGLNSVLTRTIIVNRRRRLFDSFPTPQSECRLNKSKRVQIYCLIPNRHAASVKLRVASRPRRRLGLIHRNQVSGKVR